MSKEKIVMEIIWNKLFSQSNSTIWQNKVIGSCRNTMCSVGNNNI